MTLAIQEYLRSRHVYSLRPPDAGFDSPYAEFLFATPHRGTASTSPERWPSSFASNGIPARVVVGFTSGEQERPGVFVVFEQRRATRGVEVYFPGWGGLQFDPTPGRRIPSAGDAPASGPSAAAAARAGQGHRVADADAWPRRCARARVADPGGPGSPAAAPVESNSLPAWALMLLAVLAAVPAGRAMLPSAVACSAAPGKHVSRRPWRSCTPT